MVNSIRLSPEDIKVLDNKLAYISRHEYERDNIQLKENYHELDSVVTELENHYTSRGTITIHEMPWDMKAAFFRWRNGINSIAGLRRKQVKSDKRHARFDKKGESDE